MALTPLTEAERDLVLPWRNAPEVRKNSFTQHEISVEEHRAWFDRMQADPCSRWYLYRDKAGDPQGVVYFTNIDPEQGTAFCGFYARPGAPGGTGTRMLFEALEHAFGDLGLAKVMGEVIDGNEASLRLHQRCGFTHEGTFRAQFHDGEARRDVLRLGLLAEEWPEYREGVSRRVEYVDGLARESGSPPPSFRITVLSDADSWINAWIPDLMEEWTAQGHQVDWGHAPARAEPADFCFCLGLGQMVSRSVRARFRHTLVVHASNLPQGRGWSPLTWQILEGADQIPVSLLEAVAEVDAGPIYLQEWFGLEGHELIDELRHRLGESTHGLCRRFVDEFPRPVEECREQTGEPSWYPRRSPADSELDPERSLCEQFELLQVADNERYPVWFRLRGRAYVLRVEEAPGGSAT